MPHTKSLLTILGVNAATWTVILTDFNLIIATLTGIVSLLWIIRKYNKDK